MNALLDLAAIRARFPVSRVAARDVKLQRAPGGELKGCCPFHEDKSPSFTIFGDGRRFHCFGCGASGDVLDYVQRREGVGLIEAAARLGAGALTTTAPLQRKPVEPEHDRTAEAVEIWRNAVAAEGTPADTYLRSRGLDCAIPASLRFARLRYGRRGVLHPCLVALVASPDNRAVGVHRIYLNAGGTGKAPVPKPKLSLGRIRGGAVRLAPAAVQMIVTEGIEDALSLQQQLGTAAWAAAGAGMLRSIILPPGARTVIIGADRDVAGEAAAQETATRFAAEGREVRILRPLPGFKDFNDEMQGRRR